MNQIYTLILGLVMLTSSCSHSQHSSGENSLLIAHINIVLVETGEILEDQFVYIKKDRIDTITPIQLDRKVSKIIDGTGDFLIPGLIDAHVHATAGPPDVMIDLLRKTLKGGVTTVRDMGGDMEVVKNWQTEEYFIPLIEFSAVFAGNSWMANDPRAKSSAHGSLPGTTPWLKSISDTTNIPLAIEEAREYGVSGIKTYADIPEKIFSEIVIEANRQGLPVWSHATVFPIGPLEVASQKVSAMSHSEILLYALDRNIPNIYHDARISSRSYTTSDLQGEKFMQLLQTMLEHQITLDATLLVTQIRADQLGAQQQAIAELSYKATRMAHESGINVVAGTDAMIDRDGTLPNIHKEMLLLKEKAGFSDLEALQAATLNAKKIFSTETYPMISTGQDANLIILSANPLIDIKNTKLIKTVIFHGQVVR